MMNSEVESNLEQRKSTEQGLIQEVWSAMWQKLADIDMKDALPQSPPPFSFAQLRKDPYDGGESFLAEWHDQFGSVKGNIVIHATGNAFAEFDIVKPHPIKKKWLIEATSAWGTPGRISAELRLLENVE